MAESTSQPFRRSALRATGAVHVAQESSQTASALAPSPGIDDGESELLDLVNDLVATFASSKGIDSQRLLQRASEGQSLRHALALPSQVVDFLYSRVHRWFTIGQLDKAEALFRALCLLDDSVADYWVGLGVCLKMRLALDQAMAAFDTAARLQPEWAIPRFHTLELFLRREQWSAAATELAAFERRLNRDVPAAMAAEAARYKAALAWRTRAGATAASDHRLIEAPRHEPH